MTKKKIAIVYDWMDKWGGVERILLTLSELFPEADFFSSYWDKTKAPWAKEMSIKTSFIDALPGIIKKSRILSFPLYPFAFEAFDFSGYNLVISVTSSFAKSVVTKPEVKHVCYLLTPTRYLWLYPENYLKNDAVRFLAKGYINQMKNWDFVAAQRPDKIISISKTVAERCRKYYQRESDVIYPPFNMEYWDGIKSNNHDQGLKPKITDQKYFLVVSRLEPYKKVDLTVRSFNRLNKKLVIVGEGSEENKLKKTAGKNIRFIKKITDTELARLYNQAEALIMPQEEDFGYVSLEAQFFNCPVISFNRGGGQETIINGKTGLFFDEQTEGSLLSALERFEQISYNVKSGIKNLNKKNLEHFSKNNFINLFTNQL